MDYEKVKDKKFRAHKVVLAANLKYFETMFLNSFQESTQDVVNMQDVDESHLEAFISFAYTGEIQLTDVNALGFLEIANYLGEDGIKESCIEILKLHLKKEEAYRAYNTANYIDCFSLKNAATQTILSNFGYCSQTTEFLDLDFESLKYILSSACLEFAESQKIFFEGVVRWILHNATDRRAYVNVLLDIIETTRLKTDYLLKYLCKNVENQDSGNVVKDIMAYYDERTQETQHQTQHLTHRLMIIGSVDKKLQVQYYDFTEKKWSRLHEIIYLENSYCRLGVILNDKFYYTIENPEQSTNANLQVYNPTTKQNTILTSDINSFSGKACTCGRFIYFCGGKNDDTATSDQILKYHPLTNSFEALPPMTTVRSFAAAIFYQGCLYVLGGINKFKSGCYNSVEKYDPDTKKWTDFPSMYEKRFYHSVALLDDRLYVCGGAGKCSVEVFDPSTNSWQLVACMNKKREKFLVIAHEEKLFAIGGDDESTVEVYDPLKDEWLIDRELSSGLQIKDPEGGLIGSGYEN